MAEHLISSEETVNCSSVDKHLNNPNSDACDTSAVATRVTSETDQLLENGSGIISIHKTWRHLLIGPVVWLYFFSMLSGFFVLVEYTNNYWKNEEYSKANLSQQDVYTPCDANVSSIVLSTETKASSKSSKWNMYYSLAAGIPAVLSNLILGANMDSLGRRPILIISTLGTILRLLIQGIVLYFNADLAFLLIACVVEGCTGQHATIFAVSLAYVADITMVGKSRAIGMAVIEGTVGVAIATSGLATGYMVQSLGFKTTTFISAGLLVLALLIAVFVLPETFKKSYDRTGKSLFFKLKVVFYFFTRNDEKNSRWKYQLIITSLVLTNITILSRMPTETLYQLAHPFCWSPRKIGIYVAVRTMCMMSLGFGSLKLWQKFLDVVSLAMIGNVSFAGAFVWTAFLTDDLSYYLVIAVGLFGPFSTAMQRTMLSHLTPPDQQGAIFTSVGVLEIVASLVGNVTTSTIYAETVSVMRGLVFLVLGGYNLIALLLTAILKVGWHIERRQQLN